MTSAGDAPLLVEAFFWIVCAVLVAAGASKVTDPSGTGAALAALGLPGGESTARVLGAVEVVIGLLGLAVGGVAVAVAVAGAYAFFAVVVVVARRRGLPSCGCFGARSAPPSSVHVVVNVFSAAVGVTAAVTGAGGVTDGLRGTGAGAAVVVTALVLLGAALVIIADTLLVEVLERTAELRAQNRLSAGTAGEEGAR